MKFERLTIPNWPAPRPRRLQPAGPRAGSIPWWERRWVRRVHLGRPRAFHPLRRRLALFRARPAVVGDAARLPAAAADQRPRLSTATPVQTFARERRVELAYDEFRRCWSTPSSRPRTRPSSAISGIDYPGPARRGLRLCRPRAAPAARAPGGSTITQQVAKYLLQDRATIFGDRKIREAFLAWRIEIDADQAADPRALPQPDLPRPQRLWRPGGGARLFRQGRQRADPARSGLSRRPAQGAGQLRSGARDPAALDRRNFVLREMCSNGFITDAQHDEAAADAARHGPLRQQREIPPAGRLFHGGGPPRADQALRRECRATARTASMPAACGCAPP